MIWQQLCLPELISCCDSGRIRTATCIPDETDWLEFQALILLRVLPKNSWLCALIALGLNNSAMMLLMPSSAQANAKSKCVQLKNWSQEK